MNALLDSAETDLYVSYPWFPMAVFVLVWLELRRGVSNGRSIRNTATGGCSLLAAYIFGGAGKCTNAHSTAGRLLAMAAIVLAKLLLGPIR